MLELPHDKLYKLLAVGGLVIAALVSLGAADRYHQAELRRIEAAEKASAAKAAYTRYKEIAERQIDVARSIDGSAGDKAKRAVLDEFAKLGDEADKRAVILDAAVVELQKHGDLNKHYAFMQKLWMSVGGVVCAMALIVSIWGFTHWYRSDRRAK